MMVVRVPVLCVVAILFGCAAPPSPAGEPNANKGGPAYARALEVLERRIQAAVKKVAPERRRSRKSGNKRMESGSLSGLCFGRHH